MSIDTINIANQAGFHRLTADKDLKVYFQRQVSYEDSSA